MRIHKFLTLKVPVGAFKKKEAHFSKYHEYGTLVINVEIGEHR